MIEKAKSRVGEKSNFAFVHYDGVNVPLPDGSFDLIYSVASLQHVPKPYVYNLFFEIRRLLAETGHAVIQLLNFKGPTSETWRAEIRQQVHRSPGHWHHCYTVEELEFAVRASGFSHVDIREVGGLTWVLARPVTPPM
jgi:SAM-dependent methyltransferase